jgi:hypothetical protein
MDNFNRGSWASTGEQCGGGHLLYPRFMALNVDTIFSGTLALPLPQLHIYFYVQKYGSNTFDKI